MPEDMSDNNVWDDGLLHDSAMNSQGELHLNVEATNDTNYEDVNPYASYHTMQTNNQYEDPEDVWGVSQSKLSFDNDTKGISSEVNFNDEANYVDEFKIQNELAHTMKSILLTDPANENRDENDAVNDSNDANSVNGNTNFYDQTEHVHYEDNNHLHRKSDLGNPFLASSTDEQGKDLQLRADIHILKEKKDELINSLTKDATSHGFLKGESNDKINPDDFFAFAPLKAKNGLEVSTDDSPLNNLLNITASSGSNEPTLKNGTANDNMSSFDRTSRYKTVVSPNRKVKILRPRRIVKSQMNLENNKSSSSASLSSPLQHGVSLDPLSSLTSDANDNSRDSLLLSPNTRKQKIINETEASLFNVNRSQVVQDNKEPLSPVTSNTKAPSSGQYPTDKDIIQFDITVGDPLKVGELTNAHVVYSISTVTKSELMAQEETTVTRRYRDFLWLYNQLLNNHPGYIIPPPPEKQVYGRFDDKFIENRRLALENMLIRIAQRKVLQSDPDFIVFLQSSNFSEESKQRETVIHHNIDAQSSAELEPATNMNPPMNTMAQILNAAAILGIHEPSSSGGFFSSLIGLNAPKYVEDDSFILEKQAYIEKLDGQLRQLTGSLDMILEKREELNFSLTDVIAVIQQLSDLEVNVEITDILSHFEELQSKVRDLLEHANMQQILTFGSTIDEYVRLIGSIKNCFENRLKICNSVATIKQHQEKKSQGLAKLKGKYQNQPDKIRRYEDELSKINNILDNQIKSRDDFDDIFRKELDKFEFDKVKDFKNVIEIYWESLIENQKLLIELWETFYEKCGFDSNDKQ